MNSTSTATCLGRRENPWRSGRPGLFEPLQCPSAQHHDFVFGKVSMHQLLGVHALALLGSATVHSHKTMLILPVCTVLYDYKSISIAFLFFSLLVVLENGTGTFLQKNVSVAWCIFLQSLSVKSKSRLYEGSRILQVANELCQKSYFKLWFSRNIYNAAAWYHNHCLGQMPVVMVTEDEDAIRQYGNETEGVFVISFKVTCQKNQSFPFCCIKMMK